MTRPASVRSSIAVAVKALDRPGWDPQLHPRDRRGRFIETGAQVALWGGGTGWVVRPLPAGRVLVEHDDGFTTIVDQGYVTVTTPPEPDREPDPPDPGPQPGSLTTADVAGNVARLRVGDQFRARPTNSTGADKYRRYRVRRASDNQSVGQIDQLPGGGWGDDEGIVHATRDEALVAVANRAAGAADDPVDNADRHVAGRVERALRDAQERLSISIVEVRSRGFDSDTRGANERMAEELAETLMPQAVGPTQQSLHHRLLPLVSRMRARADAALDRQLADADPENRPDILRRFQIHPPQWDFGRTAMSLVLARRRVENATFPPRSAPPRMPQFDPGTDLATRVAGFRAALPDDLANFDRLPRSRALFPSLDLDRLRGGQVPAPEIVTAWEPDVAADGGPGETTMARLRILRAAGRELNRELDRRLNPMTIEQRRRLRIELEGIEDAYTALRNRTEDQRTEIRDRIAATRGYSDYGQLLDVERASGDPDLRRQVEDIDQRAGQELAPESRRMRTLRASIRRIRDQVFRVPDGGDLRREAVRMLGELRSVGGGGITYRDPRTGFELSDRGLNVQAMRWAEASYPSDWLARARARGPIQLGPDHPRAFYDKSVRMIALSHGVAHVDEGGSYGHAAVHELGHEMEQAVPGLLAAQRALLWDRTATGKIGNRSREELSHIASYPPDERGRRDEFPAHYTGKEYYGTAYEVLTTSMESLMAGSAYLDEGLRVWLLGTLALF